MGRSVLVVEDEPAQRTLLSSMLERSLLKAELVGDAESALEALGRSDFDAILSDVCMPGQSGIDLVREARRVSPDTPVVLITGFATIESAVESIRAGAFDYIAKPFRRSQLMGVLERALEHREACRAQPPGSPLRARGELVGAGTRMRKVHALIEKVASNSGNVLITGESGTGKELVARRVHSRGPRASTPFIAVNCTAIPEGLLESELFGHVRGAFTGAIKSKRGLFELADGGTLFLDEIGDMEMGLQSKLLRVLQEREIRPVGAAEARSIDVRIIAATHQDLNEAVRAGTFRRDLFYRLNVLPIRLPPLRERPEDVAELVDYFVERASRGRDLEVAPGVVEALAGLPWEGNIRELENAIERAVALCDGNTIRLDDLQIAGSLEGATDIADEDALIRAIAGHGLKLREVEDRLIEEALRRSGGNKEEAARALGISRRTLYRRGPGASDTEG
jgi:DNA-binding NtrC family response regulator